MYLGPYALTEVKMKQPKVRSISIIIFIDIHLWYCPDFLGVPFNPYR